MINLYAEYIKERDNREYVEIPDVGFITYSTHGDECYIENVFVLKDKRQQGLGRELLSKVEEKAKEAGCKFLTSNVRPHQRAVASTSMRAHLAVGFHIHSVTGDSIIMIKELDHE